MTKTFLIVNTCNSAIVPPFVKLIALLLYNTLSYSPMRPVFHIGICLVEKLCSMPFIVDLLCSEVWDNMSARYYWRIVIFICMVLHCRFLCFLLRGLCFMRVLWCIGCLLSVNSRRWNYCRITSVDY
jgi:hypothetical protein